MAVLMSVIRIRSFTQTLLSSLAPVYVLCGWGIQRGKKMICDPLEFEFKAFVSHQTQVLRRISEPS